MLPVILIEVFTLAGCPMPELYRPVLLFGGIVVLIGFPYLTAYERSLRGWNMEVNLVCPPDHLPRLF